MKLRAATSNPGKLAELLRAFAEEGAAAPEFEMAFEMAFEIASLDGIRNIQPPEETGATYEENASLKAIYYSQFTGDPVLAEDSGLEVAALDAAPGVRSARYAGEGASDEENNALLLRAMAGIEERGAQFVSVTAVAQRGVLLASSRGTVAGLILDAPRGKNGFGYDPLFFYPAFGRTFAEVDPARKFQVSHRGNALRSLVRALRARTALTPGSNRG
jgi:XTP/dITP diphosphohydrolase